MRLRFLTRDFYIPKGEGVRKIDGPANAVVYLYETPKGVPGALGFGGKRAKPDWHHTFRNDEQRQAHIDKFFKGQEEHAKYVQNRRAQHQAGKCTTPLDVWTKAQKDGSISAPDAAVCLRAVLARTFPGVKFSVRSDRCLDVYWTDGPTTKEVDAIAQQYSFDGFDGMIDMRYQITRWLSRDGSMSFAHTTGTTGSMGVCSEQIGDPHAPDAVEVHYGPDFVFTHRAISLPVKLELTSKVCRRYGVELPAHFENDTELERFINTTKAPDGEYLSTLVYRASTGAIQI